MVQVGEKAPNFTLPDTENRARTLKEFLAQKAVLFFCVDAFTANATKELCQFRDATSSLINLNAQIVGVDPKAPAENKQLAEKHRLRFPILSDQKGEVAQAYGLDGAKRAVFVLDEGGVVAYRWVAKDAVGDPDYGAIAQILQAAPKLHAELVVPSVITVSRQVGSGGDEIAREVAKLLGWAYFDKTLMVEVGREVGVSEEDIVDFCEDTYKVQTLVDKMLLRKKPAKQSFTIKDNAHIRKTLEEEHCLSTIQTVINNLASRGKTVIVGRGGQAILKHKLGVLHVRIVAPKTVRVERVMQSEGLSLQEAQRLVEENDKATAEYLQRFYSIDWEDPANYDIVLSTSKIDFATAAKMIATAATQNTSA